jgi:hypothetical protein
MSSGGREGGREEEIRFHKKNKSMFTHEEGCGSTERSRQTRGRREQGSKESEGCKDYVTVWFT